ncbi:MAG: tetratricopeptide repeat protein [Rhizomicrobium sp.]
MSDIFREVEEDVRRERFEKLWKNYGAYAVVALVLLFAGIAGWQFWQRHDLQERQKFSDSFVAAQRITNPQAAAGTFADLSRSAPKGYGALARLSQAGAMFASGQRDGAIDLYKQIAKDDSGPIGSVARLRAGWAMVESASRAEMTELLKPLDQPGNAWRGNAREILAYADYRAMDTKAALIKYNELALAPEGTEGLRARAKAMADFLKNGGAKSYGTVPADIVPPAGLPADPNMAAGPTAPAPAK